MEELRVEGGHLASEPPADARAEHDPEGDDDPRLPQVMRDQRRVVVAHGLRCRDLLTLRRDLAAQHDVEQEGRDREENRRCQRADDLPLVDLLRQDAVRKLFVATAGFRSAVTREQAVEGVDHRALVAPRERRSETWLNPASIAQAAARGLRGIQTTPKLRSSGNAPLRAA